ncbi:mechanosensitive ion channel family protein [Photobacterium alginatilyticum]|uniref:mechanosensitive ion channel family protein n=1 Tax=Photobacterium alginatilyticum TaxID=1775171 RepID=UPI004069326B
MIKILIMLCVFLATSLPALASSDYVFADTSSPKATVKSFLASSDVLIEYWRNEQLAAPQAQHAYLQVIRTMDLSQIPNRNRTVVVMERVLLLREVLDRLEGDALWEAPTLESDSLVSVERWRIPNTDLAIVRHDVDDKQGQYLFSPGTMQQLPRWYRSMLVLPYRDQDRVEYYQEFLVNPGPLFPKQFIQSLPSQLMQLMGPLPLWQWGALAGVFFVCNLLIRLSFLLGEYWNTRWEMKGMKWKVGKLLSLIGVVVILFLARKVIDDGIWITGGVYQFLSSTFLLGQFFFVSWLIMALFNYFATIYAFNKHNGKHVDSSLITVLARIFGGLTIVILGVYIIEFMGFSISPILAGIGVGGLAVALAIRPVLENVINGLTLYADGGIKIGELCKYGDKLGTIESIGLRSTRIRTLERSLITIPNSEFANMEIDNLERRDKRRMEHVFRVRAELTQDQLKLLLVNTRRILLQHPKLEEDPVRVRFMGVGEFAVLVNVVAYIRCRDHEEFMAVQEDVLFSIVQQTEAVGAQLAFSNQYQFAGNLAAMDEKLKEKAAQTVQHWHDSSNYPFPDFSYEYKYEIKDSIVYPVKTSATRLSG